jgi:hypothetical protein
VLLRRLQWRTRVQRPRRAHRAKSCPPSDPVGHRGATSLRRQCGPGRRGVRETGVTAGLERCYQQAETGDRSCKGVEVDAGDGIEGAAGKLAAVGSGFGLAPAAEQPSEKAEQEVPATACRVDGGRGVQAKGRQRRLQRVVERMNSCTNTGVWSSAYCFLACSERRRPPATTPPSSAAGGCANACPTSSAAWGGDGRALLHHTRLSERRLPPGRLLEEEGSGGACAVDLSRGSQPATPEPAGTPFQGS